MLILKAAPGEASKLTKSVNLKAGSFQQIKAFSTQIKLENQA
jgi:hypothetical protein